MYRWIEVYPCKKKIDDWLLLPRSTVFFCLASVSEFAVEMKTDARRITVRNLAPMCRRWSCLTFSLLFLLWALLRFLLFLKREANCQQKENRHEGCSLGSRDASGRDKSGEEKVIIIVLKKRDSSVPMIWSMKALFNGVPASTSSSYFSCLFRYCYIFIFLFPFCFVAYCYYYYYYFFLPFLLLVNTAFLLLSLFIIISFSLQSGIYVCKTYLFYFKPAQCRDLVCIAPFPLFSCSRLIFTCIFSLLRIRVLAWQRGRL